MRRDEEQDSSVYAIVFAITIALFLFVGYQGYKRYFKKAGGRTPGLEAQIKHTPPVQDDGYDRAPSSLPPLRVDGGVMGGSK